MFNRFKLHDAAIDYALQGFAVFPCTRDLKPLNEGGPSNATTDCGQITDWWTKHPKAVVGLPCSENGLVGLDLDTERLGVQEALERTAKIDLTDHPFQVIGVRGRRYFYFRGDSTSSQTAALGIDGCDVRGRDSFVPAPDGEDYVLAGSKAGHDAKVCKKIPLMPTALAEALHSRLRASAATALVDVMTDALAHIPPNQETRAIVGQALHHESLGDPDGFAAWLKWSRTGEDFEEARHIKRWEGFAANRTERRTIKTIFGLAVRNGWSDEHEKVKQKELV